MRSAERGLCPAERGPSDERAPYPPRARRFAPRSAPREAAANRTADSPLFLPAANELTSGMAQAWVATDYGSLDKLELLEVEVPEPGPGEVTIDVRAAGMNPTDYKGVLRGGNRENLPLRLGYEVAGVVTALGPDTELASG